ncbi:MAG: 30S ribosomal protein S9 [Chloroflexi bacterium]|nr:30S ribosomal protein S9 [Chloroflexota bacterium]MBE3117193.1 30S ribosomal protein S9 [Candidatus Atribacteria bacterium]
MSVQYFEGIGRRKQSIARVRIMAGAGRFIVNDKDAPAFFNRLGDLEAILAPMKAAGQDTKTYDITVLVSGGGVTGQTDSVQLGLARALVKMDPENVKAMRKGGFLTRDARVKERKKPGLKRARKAPTYTKR